MSEPRTYKILIQWTFKGERGGVSQFFLDFLGLDIFRSPGYLVSKMGSLAPQLPTVAEIRCVKDGSFFRVFGNLYRKMPKNWDPNFDPLGFFLGDGMSRYPFFGF